MSINNVDRDKKIENKRIIDKIVNWNYNLGVKLGHRSFLPDKDDKLGMQIFKIQIITGLTLFSILFLWTTILIISRSILFFKITFRWIFILFFILAYFGGLSNIVLFYHIKRYDMVVFNIIYLIFITIILIGLLFFVEIPIFTGG